MTKNILFVQWNSFMIKGVLRAFSELQTNVDIFEYYFTNWEKDDLFCDKLEKFIHNRENGYYDVIFSINYCPLISNIAQNNNIRYVFWVYDCPLNIRDLSSLKNSVNSGYFFDKSQVAEYRAMGVNAQYMPLAADSRDFGKDRCSFDDFKCDISLLGKLYKTDYDYYCKPLDSYSKGYLEGILGSQLKLYGAYILPELLTDSFLHNLNEQYSIASNGKVHIGMRELEYMLACEVTARERFLVAKILSSIGTMDIYSPDMDSRLDKAHFHGYIDYYSQMPDVFNHSKINLNISLKTITAGIPLRVFDVLACGGFLISNYQPGIEELFEIGNELIIYESIEDLADKAIYYLNHESERIQIAKNGYAAIKERHGYKDKIQEMLK